MGREPCFEWTSKIMAITAENCKLFALATSLSTHTGTLAEMQMAIGSGVCVNIPTCTWHRPFNNSMFLMATDRQ